MAKAKKVSKLKLYPITCLSKADIIQEFKYNNNKDLIIKKVKKLTISEMKELASKMANDYLEQLYWVSLRTIFESKYMEEIENESQTER